MKIKNKFYHFIVSIILVVSLLAGTIVPANTIVKADDNNPTIWTSYEQSNGVVTIHYYGTGITNLSSYQMLIKYDNEKLSYKECKFSSELGSTITSAKESQGTIKIALINGNGLSVTDKELFAITYTADFVGSEQCVFNTNINEAYDRNLSNIDFNIDSQLTINVDNPLSDNYQVNLEGTTDANANDTVQCRFGLSRNAGVMSGSFILHYNEEQVRFQKVTANKNVEGLIVSYNKVEEGTVKVAYAFNKCSTTTMNFLNMEFIPLEKSTSSNISLSDVTITNEQLQECTFDGSYEATISTSEQQSDNLFTVNGLDSIDSQETFDVTINLAGNSGIASMTANVSTSTKGKVKFAFMSTDDIKADGQVIKLTFKAIKNENVSGKFQLVVDELTDSNATKQEYNIADLTTKVNKICIHNYIGPDFQWSDDYSTCKAVYTCEYNSEHVIKVDCDVETTRTEATCEEDGNITHTATGTYNNQKITDVQKETIPAKGHVKGEVKIENATESTCEKGGSYDEVVYCTVCNKELSRTTVKTEAKGHKWNEGKITTEPTCTEEGMKTFECTVCGKTKTEKVSAWGHDWNEDFTVDKEATCEETGLKSIHCKRCDERKEITTIPAKGHVKGEVKIENVTESTCEKGGSYDEVVYCTVCNKELSRTTVKTEAKGHKWNNGKVTTEPTYAEEGVKTYTCTACGATKTEVIPKRNMEYTVGSTYQDISTNAIYRITVINQQVEYVCPIDKKLKKATIPSQIRIGNVTYKVTSIGNNAFKRCKNLSSITIGNNISKIGNKAFYNCKKLKKIKIKSKKLTLKKIGKSAFKKINKKAKISVPKSKKKSYKKMLTKKGLSKTVKIK